MEDHEALYVGVKNSEISWSTITDNIENVWKSLVWIEFGHEIIRYSFGNVPKDEVEALKAKGWKAVKAKIVIEEE